MVEDDDDRQYLFLPGMSWVGEWTVRQLLRQILEIVIGHDDQYD